MKHALASRRFKKFFRRVERSEHHYKDGSPEGCAKDDCPNAQDTPRDTIYQFTTDCPPSSFGEVHSQITALGHIVSRFSFLGRVPIRQSQPRCSREGGVGKVSPMIRVHCGSDPVAPR
jgi:hypothetical protein